VEQPVDFLHDVAQGPQLRQATGDTLQHLPLARRQSRWTNRWRWSNRAVTFASCRWARRAAGAVALRGRPRRCLGIFAFNSLRSLARACRTALVISLRMWKEQTWCGTPGKISAKGTG